MRDLPNLIRSDVDHHDCSANIASGLNTAWHEAQKSKKKRVTIATEKMDNAAAMSMRPNFPPSPRFDRQAANDQLAKVKPDKRNPSRKNTVSLFYGQGASYAEYNLPSLLPLSQSTRIPTRCSLLL